jgi:nucleoid DNA-binding protein
MERVLKILMERDDMSRGDAMELIENFVEELEEAIMSGDICECEELLNLHFGLEDDFLTDFLL